MAPRGLVPAAVSLCALFLISVIASSDARGTRPAPGRSPNVFVQSGSGPGPRIIGGYDAAPGQFPYQVSLRSTARSDWGGHFCGGSILNNSTILTAAHCVWRVTDVGQLYIVAGSNLLSEGGVKIFVKDKLVHPDYGPVYYDYDVALLYLQSPLPMNDPNIKAVELQDVATLPAGFPCVATGWGTTAEGGSPLPNKLQAVDVPIVDYETCATFYSEDQDYSPIIETQICAGYEQGMRDACQGDSGGPLVCNGKLTGIVSWGSGCAEPQLPGVYTDVAFLLDWIVENGGGGSNETSTTTSAAVLTSPGPWVLTAILLATVLT